MRAALFLILTGCTQLFGLDGGELPGEPSIDASPIDGDGTDSDDGAECEWSYVPSTFDPCGALPPALGKLALTTHELDTMMGTLDGSGPELGMLMTFNQQQVRVVHVAGLTIMAGVLTVTGTVPLLIVSEGDVIIDGTITVVPGTGASMCSGGRGDLASTGSAGGGGGGGNSFAGGSGGGGTAGNDGGVAGIMTNDGLSRLVGGCAGGAGGGTALSGTGALGGLGGGALQISSRTVLKGSGAIRAAGGGGDHGLCGASCVMASGGGGGGAGGTVILEGALADSTKPEVCVGGGGGGSGGFMPDGSMPSGGELGTCLEARGGNSQVSASGGGNGNAVGPGGKGQVGGAATQAGGGGGGGGGRVLDRVPVI